MIDPQSHPTKSTEGSSPPPNSATTSGSTSTPTSGESSGVDKKHGGQHHVPSTSHFPQPMHEQSSEGWPVAFRHGMITQPYTDLDQTPPSHGGGMVDPSTSAPHGSRYSAASYSSAIKLLVSNNVAGSIIGRSGQTISELQTQSSARIKLSQTGDFYPGTQDRVCLVQGQMENVKVAVQLLLERLHMLQEQQHSQHLAWQSKPEEDVSAAASAAAGTPLASPPTDFDFVVRILVPSSCCGMIIGKAGANIKHMEESSGVSSVRLSPKEGADPANPTAAIVSGTAERVVTLTGSTVDCCAKCIFIVLHGMAANQEISRYTNMTTSYSRLIIPGAYTPMAQAGRPILVVPAPTAEWDAQGHYGQFAAKRSTSQPDLAQMATMEVQRVPPQMPPGSPSGGASSPAIAPPRDPMQQFSPAYHDDGSPPFSTEMGPSMIPLLPMTTRGPPSTLGGAPMYLLPAHSNTPLDHISASTSAPDLLALQFQDSVRISNPPPTSAPVDYSHFAPQLPQPTPPGFTAQVLVPDTLVGSILGRGGRALNDLQIHSNTRIRISQRGEYVPGTRNRIVMIRGPTAQSVTLAQYLMSQRMVLPPTAGFSPQAASVAAGFHHPIQYQPAQRFPPQHASPSPHAILPHHHLQHHHQQQAQHPPHFNDSTFLPSTVGDPQAVASVGQSNISLAPLQGGCDSNELPPHN